MVLLVWFCGCVWGHLFADLFSGFPGDCGGGLKTVLGSFTGGKWWSIRAVGVAFG